MIRDEPSLQRSREEHAREEVGRTRISKGLALLLTAQFLLAVGAVPLDEILYDVRNPEAQGLSDRLAQLARPFLSRDGDAGTSLVSRVRTKNRALIAELDRFGDAMEDASRLGRRLRPPTQGLLVGLGAGNEQVYLGRNGWLFFRDDLDYVTGGDFLESNDPRPAILDLHRQLAERGIALVVVPTPVKPSIHPEQFVGGESDRETPLRPVVFDRFVRDLTEQGVLVFDPAPPILETRSRDGTSYLKTDTHWRPEAMELTAERLARVLASELDLPPLTSMTLSTERVDVESVGDTTYMLGLSEGQSRYPRERVSITRIVNTDGTRWRPDRSADVLLLGDSFTNMYSLGGMGWGDAAGLAEHLSFRLGRPVDRIVQNAGGAFATRDELARELARGSDRLSGKRVVIFQFAERELASGDWSLVELAF